jgi:ABC-2 type transport system ATP-binding protein
MKEPTLHDAFIALTGDHPDEDQSVARDAAHDGLKAEAAR